MAEAFDVLVIGGGHNGLALACYLQKAGLKTLVLERRPFVGGGVISQEFIPGFKFSTHAVNHNWIHIGPVYRDLELERYGSRYVFPPLICSHLFSDGRSLTLHRDLEATVREIEKFSSTDARRYRDWVRGHKETFDFLARQLFRPPEPPSRIFARLEETAWGRRIMRMSLMSIFDVAEELLEDECVKVWFVNYCLQTIQDPFVKGSGLIPVALLVNQHLSAGNSLALGGAGTLTQAMANFLEAHGGGVRVGAEVERILLKGGRAQGVRLADGSEIFAEKAVVSNVEPKRVFLNLLDEEGLPEEFLEQVRSFQYSYFTIFGIYLALSEDARYRASSPEPNHSFNVMLGVDTLDDIRKQFYDLSLGLPPEPPGYMALHPTRFDPSIALPGKHIAILWQYAPCFLRGGDERWDALKDGYAKACIDLLLRSTRNLNEGKIIGKLVYTPLDIARDNPSMVGGDMHSGRITQDQMGIFRPFPGYGSYRTPVEGLYLCGPSTHPRGGCHGANGYNAAGIVAEDLGVKKWWEGGR